jgi:hypothetical protein
MVRYFRTAINPFWVRENYSFERLIKRVANLFEISPKELLSAANKPTQSNPEALYVTGGIENLG